MDDLDDLDEFHSDPEVVRYIPWPVRTLEQTREALEVKLERGTVTEEGGWLVLAIELRETGHVIGEILLKCASLELAEAEIGYALSGRHQGRGFASEAASAMLALAFGPLALRRVTAVLDARNVASAALLERLGMRREAHFMSAQRFKGEWVDTLEYAILAAEYVEGAPQETPAILEDNG
jgi:RimJ/RimL family protein N-acetyltransferase